MANGNRLKFGSNEERDPYLQSSSVEDLKGFTDELVFYSVSKNSRDEDAEFSGEDQQIMALSIEELRSLTSGLHPMAEKFPIEKKVKLTGLSEETIQKIETDKYQATLQEIIAYCKGLKIPYKEFLSELFQEPNAA